MSESVNANKVAATSNINCHFISIFVRTRVCAIEAVKLLVQTGMWSRVLDKLSSACIWIIMLQKSVETVLVSVVSHVLFFLKNLLRLENHLVCSQH